MRLLSITGTRPQFVKAAPLHAELARHVELVVADTGQHYDRELTRVFNEELGLGEPDVRLEVGSGSHAEQTAAMLIGIARAVGDRRPDAMLVYGDTNSTLAGALVAAKLGVPLAHVEAGLRSFDMRMPEEVNRVVTDRLSRLLFCPSGTAVENLAAEGITRGVELVGDVMVDLARVLGPVATARRAPTRSRPCTARRTPSSPPSAASSTASAGWRGRSCCRCTRARALRSRRGACSASSSAR
jgi:UDP-N-acetylglucosamine 2-epimerase (non-hydrolysing)